MSLEWLEERTTVESIRANLWSAGLLVIIAMLIGLEMKIKNEWVSLPPKT